MEKKNAMKLVLVELEGLAHGIGHVDHYGSFKDDSAADIVHYGFSVTVENRRYGNAGYSVTTFFPLADYNIMITGITSLIDDRGKLQVERICDSLDPTNLQRVRDALKRFAIKSL